MDYVAQILENVNYICDVGIPG